MNNSIATVSENTAQKNGGPKKHPSTFEPSADDLLVLGVDENGVDLDDYFGLVNVFEEHSIQEACDQAELGDSGEFDYEDFPAYIEAFSDDDGEQCLPTLIFHRYEYEYFGPAAAVARHFFEQLWKDDADLLSIAKAVDDKVKIIVAEIYDFARRIQLPEVPLPGDGVPIRKSARDFGQLLAKHETHFTRGRQVVRFRAAEGIEPVKSHSIRSDIEKVATVVKLIHTDEGNVTREVVCSNDYASALLACSDFVDQLPKLNVVTKCSVLVDRGAELQSISGYDKESGIYANGASVPEMALHEASELLEGLLQDFKFVTPADKSRALAGFITPALVMGGLLPGRAALDLGEANESQSGKGYRHKITAAIYGDLVYGATVSEGISKLDEAFDSHVISGRFFVSLDNIRGKIDSPKIESFLTEDTYIARVAFTPPALVDPRRTYVMLTSNVTKVSPDLANRSSCVRIIKQPDGYQFKTYPEGTVLNHVRAKQAQYLGAVFAIVKHWYAMGKPRTDDSRHDFKEWAQTLDWIVQNSFGAAPLMDGHRETQQRMVSPELSWLRDMLLLVEKEGRCSEELRASDLIEMAELAGLEVPGLRPNETTEDQDAQKRCRQAMGVRLRKCFRAASKDEGQTIEVDGLAIERREDIDKHGNQCKFYIVFRPGAESPSDPF